MTNRLKTGPENLQEKPANAHSSEEMRVVTKKEIVRTISEAIGETQLETKKIVQTVFGAIIDALLEGGAPTETRRGGRIELRNFGVFEIKRRKPRRARNPRTGAKVNVPEKFVVTFKPGKEMEQRVHELEQQATRAKLAADGQATGDSAQHAGAGSNSSGS
jgi:nucleoid DNA-binding protein